MLLTFIALAQGEIVLSHTRDVSYNRTEYEAACGDYVFRLALRNGPSRRPAPGRPRGDMGTVESLTVNGVSVTGGAAELQLRAAGRTIDRAGITNCGYSERDPIMRGVLETSTLESKAINFPPNIHFTIKRVNGRWQMIVNR